MGLVQCKECGNALSSKARQCPACGAPSKRKSRPFLVGCLTIIFFPILLFAIAVYYSTTNSPDLLGDSSFSNQVQPRRQNSETPKPASDHSIPGDVQYSIIETDIIPGVKRSLTIQINKRVSEKILRRIAMKLKNEDKKHYQNTFIAYLLPDMESGKGAWATTHFNPELEVKILGISESTEANFRKSSESSNSNIIGIWLDETPYAGSIISIYKKNNSTFMKNEYSDGSSGEKELVEKATDNGRRFDDKKQNRFGEFLIINRNGNLEFWDSEGLIRTAKSTKN